MSFNTISTTAIIPDGNCIICLQEFQSGEIVLAHKHPLRDEDIHKIHKTCLGTLFATSPKRECPSCRLAITSVNGTPTQAPRRTAAPIDPLSQDAIDELIREEGDLEIMPPLEEVGSEVAPTTGMVSNHLVIQLSPSLSEGASREFRREEVHPEIAPTPVVVASLLAAQLLPSLSEDANGQLGRLSNAFDALGIGFDRDSDGLGVGVAGLRRFR